MVIRGYGYILLGLFIQTTYYRNEPFQYMHTMYIYTIYD